MKLLDIVHRQSLPQPWVDGEKIPWNDPAFSQRMLDEHLTQAHDAASRRFEIIDRHVSWIHQNLLQAKPTRILDLGCGPGFYTSRLARLGHQCVGIDFSPAAIAYARAQADAHGLDCSYLQQDIREADFGAGYGLVMFIFGEFNVFRREEAQTIVRKTYLAMQAGGHFLLEPHTFEKVESLGHQPPAWYSAETGLFAAGPHLCLQEYAWVEEQKVAIERYYILEARTGEATCHSSSMQAYTQAEYRGLLAGSGFVGLEFYAALGESADTMASGLQCIVAHKGNGALGATPMPLNRWLSSAG